MLMRRMAAQIKLDIDPKVILESFQHVNLQRLKENFAFQ